MLIYTLEHQRLASLTKAGTHCLSVGNYLALPFLCLVPHPTLLLDAIASHYTGDSAAFG